MVAQDVRLADEAIRLKIEGPEIGDRLREYRGVAIWEAKEKEKERRLFCSVLWPKGTSYSFAFSPALQFTELQKSEKTSVTICPNHLYFGADEIDVKPDRSIFIRTFSGSLVAWKCPLQFAKY